MLRIQEFNHEVNYRTLNFSGDLFHKALRNVLNGEKYFHVTDNDTDLFDLVYTDNNTETFDDPNYPDTPFFRASFFYPPYYLYDENDISKLYLKVFDGFKEVWFEECNEYTITLTEIIVKHTALTVYFEDKRILNFINDTFGFNETDKNRVLIGYPDDDKNTLRVTKNFSPKVFTNEFREYGSIGLFHDVFMLQWLTDLRMDQIKYVEICMAKSEGIGSLLAFYSKAVSFFKQYGIEVIIKKKSSRYSDEMIEKYFSIRTSIPEMNDSNTVYIDNFLATFVAKHFMETQSAKINLKIFNPVFLNHMQEYKEAVFGDKKMLGLLIRGSDYYTAGCQGIFRPASVSEMLPTIKRWMSEDHYDGIFLATEDKDVLDQVRLEFPNQVIAIAQDRYSKKDLEKLSTIHEFDKQNKDSNLEDTTINYFYALYLLSNCESFLVSSQCNGIAIVQSFKQGEFKRFCNYRVMHMQQ